MNEVVKWASSFLVVVIGLVCLACVIAKPESKFLEACAFFFWAGIVVAPAMAWWKQLIDHIENPRKI